MTALMDLDSMLRAIIRSIPTLGEDAAIQLIVGTVRRDTGARGGRPSKAVTNHFVSGSEVVSAEPPAITAEPQVGCGVASEKPVSAPPSPVAPAPRLATLIDPDLDQDLGEEKDPEKISEGGEVLRPLDGRILTTDAPLMRFPLKGSGQWSLWRPHVEDLKAAYPKLDVYAECRKALSWAQSNPVKRKTSAGMPKFLNAWMAREQDKLTARGGTPRGLHVGHVRITGDEDYGPEGEQRP